MALSQRDLNQLALNLAELIRAVRERKRPSASLVLVSAALKRTAVLKAEAHQKRVVNLQESSLRGANRLSNSFRHHK